MGIIGKIWKALGWVFLPIKRNGCFFVFMFLLGCLCIYYEYNPKAEKLYEVGWQELFFDLYIVCLILSLFPRAIRRILRFLVSAAAYATTIVDVFCFVKFFTKFNPSILQLINETTKKESQEFINSYIHLDVFDSILGNVMIILVAHLVCGLFMMWISEKRKDKHNMTLTIIGEALNNIGAKVQPLLGIATLVVLVMAAVNTLDNKKRMVELMSNNTIGQVEARLTQKDNAKLYLPIYRFIFSFYSTSLAANQVVELKEAVKELAVDSCSFDSRNIILIIGESYNKQHSQLYGYDKTTTPRQAAIRDEGYLVTFTDVITPWNLTSYVFKNLFSMHTVGDEGEWSDYALFPELFKKAGYHVTFITNQFLPKARSAVYDFSGGFFLNDTTLSRSLFDTRNSSLHVLDDGVLHDYDTLKQYNTDAQLTILHLYGQHVDYRRRYPVNRQFYHKEDYNRPKLSDKERTILAHYDNATRYNDSIVACVISRVYNDDAIVIYVPDHGEEVFNDDVHAYGRLHTEMNPRLAHEEFEIPFWIWCSKKYAAAHPEIFRRIWLARNKPLMIDALAHTLVRLAGIKTDQYKSKYDVLSPDYDTQRKRIIKDQWDYDSLMVERVKGLTK